MVQAAKSFPSSWALEPDTSFIGSAPAGPDLSRPTELKETSGCPPGHFGATVRGNSSSNKMGLLGRIGLPMMLKHLSEQRKQLDWTPSVFICMHYHSR